MRESTCPFPFLFFFFFGDKKIKNKKVKIHMGMWNYLVVRLFVWSACFAAKGRPWILHKETSVERMQGKALKFGVQLPFSMCWLCKWPPTHKTFPQKEISLSHDQFHFIYYSIWKASYCPPLPFIIFMGYQKNFGH